MLKQSNLRRTRSMRSQYKVLSRFNAYVVRCMYGHGTTAKGGGILQEYKADWIQARMPRSGGNNTRNQSRRKGHDSNMQMQGKISEKMIDKKNKDVNGCSRQCTSGGRGRKGGNYMDKRKRAQYSSRMMFKCADSISEISGEERVRNT